MSPFLNELLSRQERVLQHGQWREVYCCRSRRQAGDSWPTTQVGNSMKWEKMINNIVGRGLSWLPLLGKDEGQEGLRWKENELPPSWVSCPTNFPSQYPRIGCKLFSFSVLKMNMMLFFQVLGDVSSWRRGDKLVIASTDGVNNAEEVFVERCDIASCNVSGRLR